MWGLKGRLGTLRKEGLRGVSGKACIGSQGKACHSQKGRLARGLREGLPGVSKEDLASSGSKACVGSQKKAWHHQEEGLRGVSREGLAFPKRKACLRSLGRLALGLIALVILKNEGLPEVSGKACLGSQRKAWHPQEGRRAWGLREGLPWVSREGRKEGLRGVSKDGLASSGGKACLGSQRKAWHP